MAYWAYNKNEGKTMATYYVGWDVGAWHCDKNTNSRDAIVIQDKESEDVFLFYGNATNFFGEENLDAFLELFSLVILQKMSKTSTKLL